MAHMLHRRAMCGTAMPFASSKRAMPVVRASAAPPAEEKKQPKYHASPLSTAPPSTYAVCLQVKVVSECYTPAE